MTDAILPKPRIPPWEWRANMEARGVKYICCRCWQPILDGKDSHGEVCPPHREVHSK